MKQKSGLLDRQPPRSLEAERGLLGSLLLKPDVCGDVAHIVVASDFYDTAHQKLFGHFLAMHESGQQIDNTLLVERLKSAGHYELVGGTGYLLDLLNGAPTAAHAVHYAKIVREKATRRLAIHLGTELIRDVHESSLSAQELVDRYRAELDRIGYEGVTSTVVDAAAACAAGVKRARILIGGQGPAIGTGLGDVDQEIGGMFPGELVVLAARPRVGKTAFAIQIAMRLARASGRVLFFSGEMGNDELMLRSLCARAGVSGNALRTGRATEADIAAIALAGQELCQVRLLIDDRPRLSIADIGRTARRTMRDGGLSLIVVDYLQKLVPADPRRPRHEQVAQQATDAKTLARDLRLPVLMLAQINRESDRSADQRPTLANLRESGAVEAEADQVWLLHRGELLNPGDAYLRGKAELIVAKNRNGVTGTFELQWDGPRTTFCDVDVWASGSNPDDDF